MAASLSFIVGILGNVISLLVFASPIGTFRRILARKSTENYKSLPYISTLLSTSLWTFYGILKPGGLLVSTVNGAGAVLQFIYVIIFIIFAPKDKKMKSIIAVGVLNIGFAGAVIAVTLLAIHGSLRITVVGIICAALTIGMYASPLSAMTIVIKMKSVKYMPFFLSLFLFLNAGVWSVYSVLVKDYFIGVKDRGEDSPVFNSIHRHPCFDIPSLFHFVRGCMRGELIYPRKALVLSTYGSVD